MTRILVPPVAQSRRRSAPCPRRRRSAASRLLVAALAVLAGSAQAFGLGEIAQQSAFGDSLRIVVPVIAGTPEDLAGECVKLATARGSNDGIPEVREARIAVERTRSGARIVIASPRTVTDPLLKLTLQAGCESVVRREYVLLMDPPPIDTPVARDAVASSGATTAPLAPAARPATGAGGATGSVAARDAGTAATPRPPRRRHALPCAGARPRLRRARARRPRPPRRDRADHRQGRRRKPRRARRPRGPGSPSPTPSRRAGTPGKGAAATPAPGARAPGAPTPASDATAALDAEAAALQQRVVELTAMVDRMQQEMRAADALQAAQAARVAAENAAKTSPQAMLGRWWSEGWPLLLAVVVLAALIAAFLSYRRRRAATPAGQWRIDAAPPGRTQPQAPPAATAPPARSVAPPPVAAARTGPQVTTPGTPTTVDVSELSHVTEEAGVYLAFNRPDRAIGVLAEHISTSPRSLPAAWLMLLDLYHGQGREAEFRELAERFHAQFNAQTPSWDGYRLEGRDDRGLEAFPHLIEQLGTTWGRPECREFLDHLLHENRDGRRAGFSLAAYEDILFLRQLADAVAGDGAAARAAPRFPAAAPPRPAPAAPATGPAGAAAGTRRVPTLDLELALDEDMLDAGRPRPGDSAASPPAKDDPPKKA